MMQQVLAGVRGHRRDDVCVMPMAGGVLAHWGADVIKVENLAGVIRCACSRGDDGSPAAPTCRSRTTTGASGRWRSTLRPRRARASSTGWWRTPTCSSRAISPRPARSSRSTSTIFASENPRIIYAKGTGMVPGTRSASGVATMPRVWWARGSLADSAMQVSGAEVADGHGRPRRHDLRNGVGRRHLRRTVAARAHRRDIGRGWIVARHCDLVQPPADSGQQARRRSGAGAPGPR